MLCICQLLLRPQNGMGREQVEVCLTRIGSKSLPGLMLQGAYQAAAEPSARGCGRWC